MHAVMQPCGVPAANWRVWVSTQPKESSKARGEAEMCLAGVTSGDFGRGEGDPSLSQPHSQHFIVTPLFLCRGPAPAPAAPDADFSLRKGFVFSFSLPLHHDRFGSYNQGLNFLSQNGLMWNKWAMGLFGAGFATEKQKQLFSGLSMTADEASFQALPSPQPHFPAPQNSTDICISHIPSEAVLSCFLEIISCRS
ncbi:hypothetical protein EK904_013643 [Melospiza melodia maxima]|nr:hypothetical protein EK904_013643 [Melospiza melodia maxima]